MILDQIKTLFEAFTQAVVVLGQDFNFIWKNSAASLELNDDLGNIIEFKTLNGNQIEKVVIPTSLGSKKGYIAPLDDFLILFVSDSFSGVKTAKTQSSNSSNKELNFNTTFVSTSEAMKETVNFAKKAANVDANILFMGETGVGKTFLAKYIHNNSSRKNGPFVSINCGAIPPPLVEAELFGYEKGTFTGADQAGRIGLLETGMHGTVLLDEIAELSKDLQVKLLCAIDEKRITRVGGRKPTDLDFRLISATNKDLFKMVNEGNFREDLFYRLNVISLTIPPLCVRREDILHLANHFLEKHNIQYNVCKTFDSKVIQALIQYNWPGNIRELRNSIERMVVMSENEVITFQDLPAHIRVPSAEEKSQVCSSKEDKLRSEKDILEYEIIRQALLENKSIRKAANKLGISHPTLLRKMKKLNLGGADIAAKKR